MTVFIPVETPWILKLQHGNSNALLESVVRDVCVHLDDCRAVFTRVLGFHAGRQQDVFNNPLTCLPS